MVGMVKQNIRKWMVLLGLLLTAFSITEAATELWGRGEVPRLTDPADVPMTLEEIWTGYEQSYDKNNPLEAKIHKTWEVAGDVVVNWVQLTVGTFQGKKLVVCGYWAYPKGAKNLPGIVMFHGGPQTASESGAVNWARLPEEPLPDPSACDWDRWVGPSPTRPYNRKYLLGNWRDYQDFVGLTSLPEWGSHTIDLCQWAADMDAGGPVQFECEGDTIYGTYPNGVRLVMRTAGFKGEGDWKVSGTCPVRFEGDEGWVEADDKRDLVASDPRLLEGAPTEGASGTTPTRHVREFLDCVKSRKTTSGNASIAGNTHVVCHAASIAWTLARPLAFDPKKGVFPGDEEATRLCDWKYRDPWKLPS
jgi:hypothetical protein